MKDFPIYNVSFKLLNENFSFFCKKDRLNHIFICLRCFLLSSWVISEGCIFQKYCSLSFSCYSKGTHPFWITWFSKKNPKLKLTCKNLFDKEIKVQYYAHQSKASFLYKTVQILVLLFLLSRGSSFWKKCILWSRPMHLANSKVDLLEHISIWLFAPLDGCGT